MQRIRVLDFAGYKNHATSNYANLYSMDLTAFLKIYTTQRDNLNVPHYYNSLVSGTIDSDSLNPFGKNTLFEGYTIGDTIPPSLGDEDFINKNTQKVRGLGFKTPFTYVGWGFDTFGFPAPNEDQLWNISGIKATGTPTNKFYIGSGQNPTTHGADIQENNFLAGPLDLRWDTHRKVWTSNNNVFSAKIINTTIDGGGSMSTSDFATKFTYDVAFVEGSTTGMVVTGIVPVFPPRPTLYKVFPLATGSSCFLFHYYDGTRPKIGMMAKEKEDAVDCTSSISLVSLGGGESTSANYLSESDLSTTPLSHYYGGTNLGGSGLNGYMPMQILVARHHVSGFGRYYATAGTGIEISVNLNSPTGNFTISLASGISFTTSSGVNFDIHALSGLTTPLSISQGGTSATGQVWVDLTSTQTIDGLKQFVSGIRIPDGSLSGLSLSFASNPIDGISYPSGYPFSIITSGQIAQTISIVSGLRFYKNVNINLGYASDAPVLSVYAKSIFSGNIGESTDIQKWCNTSGSGLASVDLVGNFSAKGRSFNLIKPTGYPYTAQVNDFNIFVQTSGVSSTRYIKLFNASGYSGKELIIKDFGGLAATNNIVVSGFSGQRIDGSLDYTINSNYGVLRLVSDSINWYTT